MTGKFCERFKIIRMKFISKTPIFTTTTVKQHSNNYRTTIEALRPPTLHSAVKVEEVTTTKRRLCANEIEERINLMFRT